MDFIFGWFESCNKVGRHERGTGDENASDIQLNAFEFRSYKTKIEAQQQKLLERVVNQWCHMLVKGKKMKVDGFDEIVGLDKDLLCIEFGRGDVIPLRFMQKIEFYKENENNMVSDCQYALDVTFDDEGETLQYVFNFDQERHRLNFALTLRILRTRDPLLDASKSLEVDPPDPEDDDDPKSFKKLAETPHYAINAGIPVVFSISDLKIYKKITSTSRHVYLEFFVRYPNQDKFLYAKSPTSHIPQQVLQFDESGMKRRKGDKEEEEDAQKKEEAKKILGSELPLCAMRFDMKNVKLKIPKVPHTIFGRLMARDDYFPTAIATFQFDVLLAHLKDMRGLSPEEKKREKNGKDDGSRTDPETMGIDLRSTTKADSGLGKAEENIKAGLLTLRLLGYITDPSLERRRAHGPKKKAKNTSISMDVEEAEVQEGEGEEEEGPEDEEEEEGSDEVDGSETSAA